MREILRHARRRGSALVASLFVLGLVADVDAASPRRSAPHPQRHATTRANTLAPQRHVRQVANPTRRGSTSVPQRPANIDSSPMIDDLNKALQALDATDRDYNGHREKAIAHIGAAIHDLGIPNAKPQGNASVARAAAGTPPNTTATTPQPASDATVRKALTTLFAVHHKLTDKASTRGRIHADAQVRIAIQELVDALKTSTPTATPAPASTSTSASASASTTATARTPATAPTPAPARAPAPALAPVKPVR